MVIRIPFLMAFHVPFLMPIHIPTAKINKIIEISPLFAHEFQN